MKKSKLISICLISILGLQLWRDMMGVGASKLIYLPPEARTIHINHNVNNDK
ncbi:hypothetical protein [Lactobacillus sp. PV034]|uniref:hypothetical protein n=1 Tax=Lactobacillus sp. PV034 TaxID=2594495 RepID=UPI00223FEBAA|nr:hypothetical protein [Lactobacillus sp. PV034]